MAMAAVHDGGVERGLRDHPDTTQTAMAQMAIFNTTLSNIKDTIGEALLPAWSTFLQGVNAVVGTLGAAIEEGGALYPILVQLGAVLSIVADGVQVPGREGRRMAGRPGHDLDRNDWRHRGERDHLGANLVTNFAVGIVDARTRS